LRHIPRVTWTERFYRIQGIARIRLPCRYSFLGQAEWKLVFRSLDRAIEVDYLTGRLKVCDLQLLLRCGVPKALVLALRQAVQERLDEYKLLLACLLVFARLTDGPGFSRDSNRAIRKAASGADMDDQLLTRVRMAVTVITGRGASIEGLIKRRESFGDALISGFTSGSLKR
jgi:hypothetical protein